MMEADLIVQIQSGNTKAFEGIMRTYSHRVYRAAYLFLRNVDDASDIVQEVFIRAYKHIATFDTSRPLYPWLHSITRNLCINKVKNMNSNNVSLPETELPGSILDPESALLKQEEADAVLAAVRRLPDHFREIIELKHFQECSYAEIAEILSIPTGTVMSRLYNARMKLREKLSREEA